MEHHLPSSPPVSFPTTDILTYAFPSSAPSPLPPDHPVFVDPATSKTITHTKARQKVRQLIAGLRHHGLAPGDTLCLHSFNSIYYPLIYLAAIGTGAAFVGSNPAYKPSELRHLLITSNAKFLIVQREEVEKVVPTALEVGLTENRIFIFDDGYSSVVGKLRSWRDLLLHRESDWMTFDDESSAKNVPAVLLSTSGTTGLPKMAVMSHYAILVQAVMAEYVAGDSRRSVRRLLSLPMFHSFVLPYHILALGRGETTYVMPRFDADEFASNIERFCITDIPMVPPIAQRIFGNTYPNLDFGSLRRAVCGGAPMSAATQRRLKARMGPKARFGQLWGMSETGWVTASRSPDEDGSGSVGKLLLGVQVKIVDEEGRDVLEEGASGEILVKHPGVMMRYLGSPRSTGMCFEDGWFMTGDIGYCKDGLWYIVDRAKEMIKVRAWSVSPAEIEACITAHPGVVDAAVIGSPSDADTGEQPVAFVVTTIPAALHQEMANDVKSKVRNELASYKALSEVLLVQSIPRTMSGKILRRILKDQYKARWRRPFTEPIRDNDSEELGQRRVAEDMGVTEAKGGKVEVVSSVREILLEGKA